MCTEHRLLCVKKDHLGHRSSTFGWHGTCITMQIDNNYNHIIFSNADMVFETSPFATDGIQNSNSVRAILETDKR